MNLQSINYYQVFTICNETGFSIYHSYPVKEIKRFNIGGVVSASIYRRSNILALVGGCNNNIKTEIQPFDSNNILHIWDSDLQQSIQIIEFKHPILRTLFINSYLIVLFLTKIYFYEVEILENSFRINNTSKIISTYSNPLALFNYTLKLENQNQEVKYITLGTQPGTIYISSITVNDIHKPSSNDIMLKVHKSNISQVCLSLDGFLFATASNNGTHIKVFDVILGSNNTTLKYKLRRGYTSGDILSLSFSKDTSILLCNTDYSIHVFRLNDKDIAQSNHITFEYEYISFMNSQWISPSLILAIQCRYNTEFSWKILEFNKETNELEHRSYGRLLKDDPCRVFQ